MSLPRLLRTLRPLRPEQAWAQLVYALRGPRPPVRLAEDPPELRVESTAVPFLPAPAHVRLDETRMTLLNTEVDLGDPVDWDFSGAGPLWSYHLHQFDWLRRLDLSPERRAALMCDWHQRHRAGAGWNLHPISLRILSWGKLLLTPGALALEPDAARALRGSLADQAETLARRPEKRLQANHLLSNRIGVVFAGLLLAGPRAEGWLGSSDLLCRELARQVDADGAHVERSPMYHSLLLENLLDLLNLAQALPDHAPPELVATLREYTSRMLGALAVWTHPDGEIALFGDSAFRIAQPPSTLLGYAESLGVVPRTPRRDGLLSEAGFVRLHGGPFTVLASLAGPMPAYQPGHAHCDALSFELSVGDERVVTDTGVAEYIPGELRDASRATRSHATLEIDGQEQAEIWSAHRVGGRPSVQILDAEPPRHLEGTCSGWATRQVVHRRTFRLEEGSLRIEDRIEGTPRSIRAALPIAPGLEPQLVTGAEGKMDLRVPLASGACLCAELPREFSWTLSQSLYMPEFGRSESRPCLVGEAVSFAQADWRFWVEGETG